MINKAFSVVLGSYNRLSFLKLTINSLRRELLLLNLPSEIIVIDGGSTDGTIKWLIKQKDILTIVQHNRGKWKGNQVKRRSWGYFMNLGFQAAQGKYVLLISDDCLVVPNSIKNSYDLFEDMLKNDRKVGALAYYHRNIPIEKKYKMGFFGEKLILFFGIYRKDVLDEINYADENYNFYFGDTDLTLKIWYAGYSIEEASDSYIEHYYHATPSVRSTNMELYRKDESVFFNKWKNCFTLDEIKDVRLTYKDFDDISNEWKRFSRFKIFNFDLFLLRFKKKYKSFLQFTKKVVKRIINYNSSKKK